MIKLIARVVDVWITLGPGPPCPGDPDPQLVAPRDGTRAVALLRHVLATVVPPPQRWAALAAWSLAQIAARRLAASKPRPDSGGEIDHRP